MALSRKTVFSLGGPSYIEDPRVAEAQGWAALNQQKRGQDMSFAQALLESQANEAQGRARALAEGSKAQSQADLEWAKIAAGLEEARMREEGWTNRNEAQLGAEARNRAMQEQGLLGRSLLSDQRERELAAQQEAGRAERAGAAQRQAGLANLLKLAGLLPGPERSPSLKDRLDLGSEMSAYHDEIAKSETAPELEAKLGQIAGLGREAYAMGAPLVRSRAQELSAAYPKEGTQKWLPWLADLGAKFSSIASAYSPVGLGLEWGTDSSKRRQDAIRAALGPAWADPDPLPPNPYERLAQIPDELPRQENAREALLAALAEQLLTGE